MRRTRPLPFAIRTSLTSHAWEPTRPADAFSLQDTGCVLARWHTTRPHKFRKRNPSYDVIGCVLVSPCFPPHSTLVITAFGGAIEGSPYAYTPTFRHNTAPIRRVLMVLGPSINADSQHQFISQTRSVASLISHSSFLIL